MAFGQTTGYTLIRDPSPWGATGGREIAVPGFRCGGGITTHTPVVTGGAMVRSPRPGSYLQEKKE